MKDLELAIYLKIWYTRVVIGCAIYTRSGVVLVLTKLLNKQCIMFLTK